MNILKQDINTTADGIIELFQTEHEYVANSVIALQINNDNSLTMQSVTELGTDFIQISPAPTSTLMIFYTYNEPDVVDVNTIVPGLAPWDSKKISKIIEVISNIQTTMTNFETYLGYRVSKQEFNSWSQAMEKRIKDIESAIQLG